MARKKKKRIASRGSVNNIILRTLVSGDKYGYEIIKEVEEFSNGKIQLKQPSLYSSLSRFEEKHYVTSYWGDSEIGGRRHYYHLTEQGNEYYRKAVLKEGADDVSTDDDEIDSNIDDSTIENEITYEDDMDNDFSDSNEDITETVQLDEQVDEFIDENIEDNVIDKDTTYQDVILTEVDEDDIPAIANFEQKPEEERVIIPDHAFYTHTPMDELFTPNSQEIENVETENNTTIQNIETVVEQSVADNNTLNDREKETETIDTTAKDSFTQESAFEDEKPWLQLSTPTKISNSKISNSKYKTLYTKKPKKVQKVILDRDGIYKLRDEDYKPVKRSTTPVIIDNVGKRAKDTSIFGYTTYTESKPKEEKVYTELSEEEKRKRNENFLAKFNLLTNSKMKPISTPTPKPVPKEPEKPIDYRGKLNAIVESSQVFEDEEDPFVDLGEEENNIFNYDNTPQWNTPETESEEEIDDNEKINMEPVEEFKTKTTDNQYIENINSYTPSEDIKISRYENKSKAILMDKTYILINKLKFVFGLIMTLLMTAEMVVAHLSFKNNNVIFDGDMTVIIIGYVLVGLFALFTILPYVFNHNQHKANNFKFKYAIWFGLLTFLVLSILIYCFNALAGFELDNFKYFTVKLLVPIILSSNVFVAPLVYGILNKNKAFYD